MDNSVTVVLTEKVGDMRVTYGSDGTFSITGYSSFLVSPDQLSKLGNILVDIATEMKLQKVKLGIK